MGGPLKWYNDKADNMAAKLLGAPAMGGLATQHTPFPYILQARPKGVVRHRTTSSSLRRATIPWIWSLRTIRGEVSERPPVLPSFLAALESRKEMARQREAAGCRGKFYLELQL